MTRSSPRPIRETAMTQHVSFLSVVEDFEEKRAKIDELANKVWAQRLVLIRSRQYSAVLLAALVLGREKEVLNLGKFFS